MPEKKRNIKKILLISLCGIAIVFFALNWFLTYRLEGLLRKTLNEKVSTATNGFYTLTFDNLSVGLFNGELKITGLDLRPDSTIYNRWASGDTLPDTYFKLRIDTIDFKGINLTWRISYRKLHFDLFDMQTPKVELIKPYIDNKESTYHRSEESLYDMVAPFFDVVSVKRLNLDNATVSYTMADSIVPAVYELRNVSFKAYGFLLDENSNESGKLLYFDNFEFTTNQPQKLIENNQFTLTTKTLSLNTRDSLIDIREVNLLPRQKLWLSTGKWPGNFVKTSIPVLQVKGAAFHREKGESYFNASLLSILSSEIEYFKIDTILQKKVRVKKEKVSFNEWSLYDIVSPVLNGVTIDSIGVRDAKFSYTQVADKGIDTYKLNDFNFWANRLLVDKSSEHNASRLYSDDFGFNASDLICDIQTQNHRFNVDKIYLSTEKETFYVKGIKLEPVSTEKQFDYASGSIDSISITGLNTDKGFKANRLMIKSPDVKYVRNYAVRKPKGLEDVGESDVEKPNTIDIVTSLMHEYYIKEILLDSVNFTYEYIKPGLHLQKFRIEDFNFFAHDFLINEYTRENLDWYFTCSNFGFNLSRFDNYIFDDVYHLSAKDILFTGVNGRLRLRDVKLLPQEETWTKLPDKYVTLVTPLVELNGLNYKNKTLTVSDLTILDVYTRFVETSSNQTIINKVVKQKTDVSNIIAVNNLLVNSINLRNVDFEYNSKPSSIVMHVGLEALNIKRALWNLTRTKELKIDNIELATPQINFLSEKLDTDQGKTNSTSLSGLNKISVNTFRLTNLSLKSKVNDAKIDLELPSLSLSKLDWKIAGKDRFFKLNNINIYKPEIVAQTHTNIDTSQVSENIKSNPDIYNILSPFSDKISIGGFDLVKANADYSRFVDGHKLGEQKIYDLHFAFNGLSIDNVYKEMKLDDVSFYTKNLSFPIDNGLYTIKLDSIRLNSKDEKIRIDNLSLVSLYPKLEFAYHHPTHKDWFGLNVNSVAIEGFDFPHFLGRKEVSIRELNINDVLLENFKNKQIEVKHNLVPMIYEGLQKAPFKLNINDVNVNNFSVVYEELSKNGTIPGKIFFKGIDGHLSNVTNIVSDPNQFIRLDANGYLMNNGHFTATWQIPVSPENDRFILDAHIDGFDFKELNPIITPLAPVRIKSGTLNEAFINMDASTKGGQIKMQLLYNNLYVDFLGYKNGKTTVKKFPTRLINWVIRDNNPRKPKAVPKTVDIYVERDPYHSTFNYFVQLIMPAAAESVGVSYDKQRFAKSIPSLLKKVQEFFWHLPESTIEMDKEE